MPFLAPAAAAVGAFISAHAVAIFVTLALTAASYLMRPKMPGMGGRDDPVRGVRLNTRDTTAPVMVLYGENRIGGNDVFIEAVGADNNRLWIVQGLGEGEIEGIQSLYLNDKPHTDFGGLVSYWEHKGTDDQTVDANLAAAIPAWTDTLRNTAYVVWRLTFDLDYFRGLPERQVVVRGRKLFDFRTSVTAYSTNHVLALYDWMTNTRYGLGIAAAKIDTDSFTEVANYIDAKGWEFHYAVTADMSGQDMVDTILTHFRGEMVWWDGKYYLRYADLNDESIAMTLTDDHIAQGDDGKAMVQVSQPSTFGTSDGYRVRFIDPGKNYTEDSLIVGDALGVITDFRLYGCRNRETAGILGTYYLEREQLSRQISGTFRDDCLALEPHDLISFTSTALAISAQTMRVVDSTLRPDGLVDLVLDYEAEELYDDVYNITPESVYSCNLPDPMSEPPAVGNVQVTEEQYHYRLRTFTRMNITFDAPENYPWYSHCEVWRSFDDVAYEYLYNVNTDFAVDPVEEGTTYYIRLKVVSIWGTKQQDANDYKLSLTIQGYVSAPASLASLKTVVNQNSVNLQGAKVNDPDVELYEFRLGSSWSGAIFLSALRAPNLSLYGVKPGTHTFWCNTLSNNGMYGATPRSATVSLPDPPMGWSVVASETCDYAEAGETHTNTEQVDYGGDDYLKCTHTDGVLTGTYTSPIYDRGSVDQYLVYLTADIVVTGEGTDWDSVAPSPTTWDDLSATTKTWVDIVELPAGPQVSMKLLYGDTSPPTAEVERLEVLSTIVSGRYYQIEIQITDPQPNINAMVENFTLNFAQ